MLKQNQGVALIEALISVLIVSFGVVSLVKFQTDLHGSQAISAHRAEAQGLAQSVVNKVAGSISPATYGNGADSPAGKSTTYQRSWTVTASPLGDTLVVSQVSWLDNKGESDKVVLSGVVAKDVGLNEGKLLASAGALGSAGTGTGIGTGSNASPPWTVAPSSSPSTEDPTPITPVVVVTPDTTVTTRTISGNIHVTGKARIEGVSVTRTSGVFCVLTAVPGYTCTVPKSWSGRINLDPAPGGGKETPDYRDYSAGTANLTEQNYTIDK